MAQSRIRQLKEQRAVSDEERGRIEEEHVRAAERMRRIEDHVKKIERHLQKLGGRSAIGADGQVNRKHVEQKKELNEKFQSTLRKVSEWVGGWVRA